MNAVLQTPKTGCIYNAALYASSFNHSNLTRRRLDEPQQAAKRQESTTENRHHEGYHKIHNDVFLWK